MAYTFSGISPAMDWYSPTYTVSTNDNATNQPFAGTMLYVVTSFVDTA